MVVSVDVDHGKVPEEDCGRAGLLEDVLGREEEEVVNLMIFALGCT